MVRIDDVEMLMYALTRRRTWRSVMYAALIFGGVFITLDPSELVRGQVTPAVVYLWSGSIVVTAAGCCWGAITDKWIGEYGALPLLFASFYLYGFAALLAAREEGPLVFAFGLIMCAFASGLVSRWLEVRDVKISATEDCHKEEGA